jgi:hypothetical protein
MNQWIEIAQSRRRVVHCFVQSERVNRVSAKFRFIGLASSKQRLVSDTPCNPKREITFVNSSNGAWLSIAIT